MLLFWIFFASFAIAGIHYLIRSKWPKKIVEHYPCGRYDDGSRRSQLYPEDQRPFHLTLVEECEFCTTRTVVKPVHLGGLITTTVLLCVYLVTGIFVSATFQYKAHNVENSYYYLIEMNEQRDAILAEFDEILGNDDFVQLMNASVPEDIKFLKNNPEVSGFLLGRADRIVAINQAYFAERNKILDQSKQVCNVVQSGFIPIFPLMQPDCRLGEVLELTTSR